MVFAKLEILYASTATSTWYFIAVVNYMYNHFLLKRIPSHSVTYY